MVWWFWIVLGAVLLAAEVIIAADFYLVFFGIAALVLGLLGVFGVALPVWAQWLLFAALAVAGLVVYRGRWKRRLMTADREMAPELVGEAAVAPDGIVAGGRGSVNLRGSRWEARNVGGADIAAGARCIVEAVDGIALHVRSENREGGA